MRECLNATLVLVISALLMGACGEEHTRSVTASAYNSTVAQTDGNPIVPGMQVIAVSPDLLEAGLVYQRSVEIEGLSGTWTVLDRTASRNRNRIDIYMGVDVQAAREWGIREVAIRWSE